MKVSAKTEYACLALLELASQFDIEQPLRIKDIAGEHDIPSRFLVQILLQLKSAGLVASTRGAAGGYRLVKPPDEVALADVVSIIEGSREPESGSAAAARTPFSATLYGVWQEVTDLEQEILAGITLADLLERAEGADENMYYI